MARRQNTQKTFQQRQSEKLVSRQDRADRPCGRRGHGIAILMLERPCRDFAHQCEHRIEDLDFDLVFSELALDFWSEEPEPARGVVDALRELEAERQRHFDALTVLEKRLRELTKGDVAHHHLPLPNAHYQQKSATASSEISSSRLVHNYAASGER